VAGVIDEDTLVWGHGLMDWLPIRNVRTLVPQIRTPEGVEDGRREREREREREGGHGARSMHCKWEGVEGGAAPEEQARGRRKDSRRLLPKTSSPA
jgi:hypothetical protein